MESVKMKKRPLFPLFLVPLASLNAQMVFEEPPEQFNPQFEIASCYVSHEGRILYLKRVSSSTWSHTWSLPGGLVEEGETPMEGMVREVQEETEIDLSKETVVFLKKVYVRDPKKDFTYYMFECKLRDKPEPIRMREDEHNEYRWVLPQEALEQLPLIPGEHECLRFYSMLQLTP